MIKVIKIGSREFIDFSGTLLPVDKLAHIYFHKVSGEGIKYCTISCYHDGIKDTITTDTQPAIEFAEFLTKLGKEKS